MTNNTKRDASPKTLFHNLPIPIIMDPQTLKMILNNDPNAMAIVTALQQGVRSTEQLIAIVPYPDSFQESMNILISAGIIGPPE